MDFLLYAGDAHVCSCSRHYELRPAVSVCWNRVFIDLVENNMSEKEPKYYSVMSKLSSAREIRKSQTGNIGGGRL